MKTHFSSIETHKDKKKKKKENSEQKKCLKFSVNFHLFFYTKNTKFGGMPMETHTHKINGKRTLIDRHLGENCIHLGSKDNKIH